MVGGRDGDTDRGAGRSVEVTADRVRGAEHPDRAERRERDVEPRLREKAPLSVQRADEGRVERVDEEHAGEDPERAKDVRCVLEIRGDRRQCEKQRREARGERRVDQERPPLCFRLASGGAGDGARNALDRRRRDHVVRNVREGGHRRKCAVSVETNDARKDGLLHDPDQDEPHLGAGDGDTAAPRAARHIFVGGGGGGRRGRLG